MRRSRSSRWAFGVVLVFLGCSIAAHAGELATLNEENFESLAPRGDEAEAILGDYVLRNDRIVLVIDNPEVTRGGVSGRNGPIAACGSIIDMAPRAANGGWANHDRLGWFWTGPLWQSRDYAGRAQYDPHFARDFKPQTGKTLTLEFDHTWHTDLQPMRVKYTLEDGQAFVRCDSIYPNPAKETPAAAKPSEAGPDDQFAKALEEAAPGVAKIPPKTVAVAKPLLPTPIFELNMDGVVEKGRDAEQLLTWVYDPWFGQAFGVVEEKTWTLRLANGTERAIDPKAQATVNGGEELHVVRRVFVAADLFQLRRNVDEYLAVKRRPLKIRIGAPDGEVGGALVTAQRVRDDGGAGGPAQIYGSGRSDEHGLLEATLPDGEYDLRIEAVGRVTQTLRVKADGPIDATVQMTAPAWLVLEVADDAGAPIPCKVEVRGRDGTADPYFFPETGDRLVRNLLYLADGRAKQALAPGKYDVTITRGPEYDAVTQSIELAAPAPGKTTGDASVKTVHAKLTRTVDTTGWISVDFNGRSTRSNHPYQPPPCTGSVLGRVLNLICEGVEFAPTAEYDRISSYQPFIEQLTAGRWLATCPGVDLADGNRSHFGFPVRFDHPHWLDGGALQMPLHVGPLMWLRHWGAPADDPVKPWLTANIPGYEKCIVLSQPRNLPVKPSEGDRVPHSSFRDLDLTNAIGEPTGSYYLMRDTDDDGVADRMHYGLASGIDALDVQSLTSLDDLSARVPSDVLDWLLLRAAGYRMPGMIGSAAIDNFHGSGGLRTYVRSATDAPEKIDPLTVAREIHAGHAVMTSGPFLEATVTTAEKTTGIPGDLLTTKADSASLHIRVQCPNWITLDRVDCWVDGRIEPALTLDRAKTPGRFTDGHVQLDQTLTLSTRADTQVVVIAHGHGPNLRRHASTDDTTSRHLAVTNPILIDHGGDGFVPMSPVDEAIQIEPALVRPVMAKKDSPPGRLRLTITNHGSTPASGTAHLEVRPAGVVTIEGKPEVSFTLGANEKTTVELNLRPAVDTQTEALMGGSDTKKMTASVYVLRSAAPPGIAPAKLSIVVDDAAKMLDSDDVR